MVSAEATLAISLSSNLLELAADNDVDGFRWVLARDLAAVDEAGLWYSRRHGGAPD